MTGYRKVTEDVQTREVLVALVSKLSGRSIEELKDMANKEILDYVLFGYWPNMQTEPGITKKHLSKQA